VSDSPEYTYHELSKKTVAELREIAAGIDHPAVRGYTQKRKAEVLASICEALDIDTHEHHQVVGIDRGAVRREIREWKARRDAALEAGDHAQLKFTRTKIRRLKRKIRRALR